MRELIVFFFAEFALLALAVPPLTLLRRSIAAKMALALAPTVLGGVVLLVLVQIFLQGELVMASATTWTVLRMQVVAVAFAAALGGLSAIAGRRWPLAGPLGVSLAALLLLTSPMWGNVLLHLDYEAISRPAETWLVRPNPLCTVTAGLGYDWSHATELYKMTRLGEDFAYAPSDWRPVAAWFGGLGLLAGGCSVLVRQKGRPSEFLPDPME